MALRSRVSVRGDNVDFNIKGLDNNNIGRSGDVMVHKKEIPLEHIPEQIVEVKAPQITEEDVEVKKMITDLVNRLQLTDDAELNMGVNADENEETIVSAVRETLYDLDKNHAPEDDEFETEMQDTFERLNNTHVTENGESETAVQDALDRLNKDHAAETNETDSKVQETSGQAEEESVERMGRV